VTSSHSQPVIGLTGGVGAGKSAVARLLRELGCLVVDSDDLVRETLREDDVKRTLRDWWGERVFDDASEVDRRAVAGIVFADEEQRRRLEGLLHPRVERKRRAIFSRAEPEVRACVIDAPLLMEAGVDRECDAVIFVDAPRAARLERVRVSRGWDEGELDRREAAQIPLDEKRRSADYVVVNDGDLHALRERVQSVLNRITLRNES